MTERNPEASMSARIITVQLPDEPPPDSVILVELTNPAYVGADAPTERRAFQRLQDRRPAAWHMVGADPIRPGLSWAEVLAHAAGRPVLVLWEPTGEA